LSVNLLAVKEMSRQAHDELAKEYLEALLSPLGTVKTSQKISSEVLEVDVWFEPSPSPPSTTLPLGILGRMTNNIALFEPYRNPISENDLRGCLSKVLIAQNKKLKEGRRKNIPVPEEQLPALWIFTPTCSARVIDMAGAREIEGEDWPKGIYFPAPLLRTGIVVIHQLPVVEETLWLRVLGRGNVQKQAVEELVELPASNPYKENLLEILANWRQNLELRDNVTNEEQEDIMNLSPAYLKQREEWKLEGKEEGRQEEAASLVLRLLTRRFGEVPQNLAQQVRELPIDDLEALGEALLDFQSLSDLVNWLGH
jgi:hypothetical protein